MADEKSPMRISHRHFATSRSEMENSEKNNADAIIFLTDKGAADVTFISHRRAKFEILPAVPPT